MSTPVDKHSKLCLLCPLYRLLEVPVLRVTWRAHWKEAPPHSHLRLVCSPGRWQEAVHRRWLAVSSSTPSNPTSCRWRSAPTSVDGCMPFQPQARAMPSSRTTPCRRKEREGCVFAVRKQGVDQRHLKQKDLQACRVTLFLGKERLVIQTSWR